MQPHTWMIDFEDGMIAALREVYPGLLVMGCYFHFTQCLVRKLQEFHLKTLYERDLEFQTLCRQFSALALVPLDLVRESFDLLVASVPQRFVRRLRPWVEYIQVPQITLLSSPFLLLISLLNFPSVFPLFLCGSLLSFSLFDFWSRSHYSHCLKITQNVVFEFLNFGIFHQFNLSGYTVWPQASGYQKLAKMDHFQHF